jgi:hypothetical protein
MNRIHKYNKPCTYVLVDKQGDFSELTEAAGLNIIEAGLLPQSVRLYHDTSNKAWVHVYCMSGCEVVFSHKFMTTQKDGPIQLHKALCKHFEGRLSVEAINGVMRGLKWFNCVVFFFLP